MNTKGKGVWLRLMLVAALLCSSVGQSFAVIIPTGNVIINLNASEPAIDPANTFLVKWRQGVANQAPVQVNPPQMTFQYFQNPNPVNIPSRGNGILDNTANGQSQIWSDNAIQIAADPASTTPIWGNDPAQAVIIHTNNAPLSPTDALNAVALRGGLVGGNNDPNDPGRASVLPLIWKAIVDVNVFKAVSNSDVNTANTPTAPFYMPEYVSTPTGGTCGNPPGNPYGTVTRTNNGFCDFSAHFFSDNNNNLDPNNLWYTLYAGGQRAGAFRYVSTAGFLGINTSEAGLGGGGRGKTFFALLGSDVSGAISTTYSATMVVEVAHL